MALGFLDKTAKPPVRGSINRALSDSEFDPLKKYFQVIDCPYEEHYQNNGDTLVIEIDHADKLPIDIVCHLMTLKPDEISYIDAGASVIIRLWWD